MYKLRWVNETGGDWMYDGNAYADLEQAEAAAMAAYADEYIDEDDIVQAWQVDEDGNTLGDDPVQEFSN